MPITPSIISYANADQFAAHCDAAGHHAGEYTDSIIEQALCRASEFLDTTYSPRFIGETATFGQPLAWPRKRAKFQGRFFPDNEIPEKIVASVCELAFMSLSETNDDQGRAVIENLLSGLIHSDQSGTAVFGSISQV
ncbi:DnaT-like ssDNA-binding protein [Pseudochrobactrum asaccharolyticum]|uniref:Putative DnaT-like domain-containing protein n=1 Tax=Pseudochrobactrum asaccharolyticum TaxID=354351 RepID=A0A366DHW8_9HYPH|nr:DnaT-like ssDNA-binding protein [Pseudochrobactrum asaccharolyticum]RBO89682.1 hypothetical protein DFR47_11549 [Pseudochrobactrum asaccharolyticum]